MNHYETKLRNKNRGHMNLIVWQRAMGLLELAWKLTHIDVSIDFKLRSQLVDAAQSVSANIAEGYGRSGIEKLEQKRDDGDWIARIMEDPEESITPSLHYSTTPSPGYA